MRSIIEHEAKIDYFMPIGNKKASLWIYGEKQRYSFTICPQDIEKLREAIQRYDEYNKI